MSHTDKDLPYAVRVRQTGHIHHDHSRGDACIVDDLSAYRSGTRHYRLNCAKRVEVHYTCTKDSPERGRWYYWYSYRSRPLCWSTVCNCPIPEEWKREPHACTDQVRTQCLGHVRYEHHPEIPCTCDDEPPRPTCYYTSPPERRWDIFGGGGIPRDYIRATWNGPERRRERDALHTAARLYNADPTSLDDFDFPSPNHRQRGRYYYH